MNTKQLLLCVLMGGPASGYDIKKIVELKASRVVDVSISNVYPALNELAAEGLVRFRKVEQENRPNKKVYELTELGREACLEAVMSMECQSRLRSEFMFVLAFVPGLPRERIDEMIDQRIVDIDRQLTALDEENGWRASSDNAHASARDFVVDLGRNILRTERLYLQRHRKSLLMQCDEAPRSDYLAAD